MSTENETTTDERERFPLDESTIKYLADLKAGEAQLVEQVKGEMMRIQGRHQGALQMFLRQHEMEGNWILAENGRELIRQPDAQALPVSQERQT